MANLKNVIEDIVLAEAVAQIKNIANPEKVSLNEVVAHALNRLPPLYASTDRGWLQQRKRAHGELNTKIQTCVRQAILNANANPSSRVESLPQPELESPANSLAKLQKLLDKRDLTWQNVPNAVQEALAALQQDSALDYQPKTKREAKTITGYLQRQKPDSSIKKPSDSAFSVKSSSKLANENLADNETKSAFQSYMLSASCYFVNALEKLVIANVQQQLSQLDSVITRTVKIEDAAAYALNRLPVMYATSTSGLQHQSQKAQTDLADEISMNVIQALITLGKAPTRMVGPLPTNKFDQQEEQALLELGKILHRDEITWSNVVSLVEEALSVSKGKTERLTKMLNQINIGLQLHLSDNDLCLAYNDFKQFLTMEVLSKYAFWSLLENPLALAKDAAEIFPEIAAIKLVSPDFVYPLVFSKAQWEAVL